jgi:hypothetical protein
MTGTYGELSAGRGRVGPTARQIISPSPLPLKKGTSRLGPSGRITLEGVLEMSNYRQFHVRLRYLPLSDEQLNVGRWNHRPRTPLRSPGRTDCIMCDANIFYALPVDNSLHCHDLSSFVWSTAMLDCRISGERSLSFFGRCLRSIAARVSKASQTCKIPMEWNEHHSSSTNNVVM